MLLHRQLQTESPMFRLEIFCDDKNLSRILHSLKGLAIGQPGIQPVANAEAKNGKVKARNGDLPGMFLAHVKKHQLKDITADHMRQFGTDHGYNPNGYGGLLKRLMESKTIRKRTGSKGSNTTYVLTEASKKLIRNG